MPAQLRSLLLSALVVCAVADPAPGRIPKVYNALITSNQNLEPSKAYPVYQPVLHDAFAFGYHPGVFYNGDFLGNRLLPAPGSPPSEPQPAQATPSSAPEAPPAEPAPSSTQAPVTTAEPPKQEPEVKPTQAPLLPPNTESPIPLNEFGLPPQVLPLGHIDSIYNALPHFSPFTYRYPSVRFYDPFDPFSFSPYAGLPGIGGIPVYRPLTNVIGSNYPVIADKAPSSATPAPAEQSDQTPPPEPSDLNFLNYLSKDPAIPNVPPPPLPQGGLKSDKNE